MRNLKLLSGGAAQGLVGRLAPVFKEKHGCTIDGTFGAVGMMRDKLEAGEPADLLILTREIVNDLAENGWVEPDKVVDVGGVEAGVAVREGAPHPSVATPDALREALLDSDEIYFPDPLKATAGIHFAGVLRKLGIAEQVSERTCLFPNGATAMRALAESGAGKAVGSTQVTEILMTPGVSLVGPLPAGLDLVTVYTAAVCASASQPDLANRLIELITAADSLAQRQEAGFA